MGKAYKKIARRIVARHTMHRTDKITAKNLGIITSLGTERSFRQCLANYLKWCDDNNITPDLRANHATLLQYLEERSEWVQQKTLNQERQAFQLVYKQKLPYLRSLQVSVYEKRSYTLEQVYEIVKRQSKKSALTTWLAFFCGVRAHEAATILPIEERPPSSHRVWSERLFIGSPAHHLYTVCGKGGLVRAIAVPIWLSEMIEQYRREFPIEILDREIRYLSHFDLAFGQSWSQSFSDASKKALCFSRGAHGLRHSYAKWRLHQILKSLEQDALADQSRALEEQALLILSQELGHFRLDIVFCYLR